MSAELLREAAALMRVDAANVRRPYGRRERFTEAVADWLDVHALAIKLNVADPSETKAALAAARAYLGRDA